MLKDLESILMPRGSSAAKLSLTDSSPSLPCPAALQGRRRDYAIPLKNKSFSCWQPLGSGRDASVAFASPAPPGTLVD